MIRVPMTGPAAQPDLVGILKDSGFQAAVTLEGVVTIVTAGICMVQVDPIGATMTLNAGLLCCLELFVVGGREVLVVTAIDVRLGRKCRAQRHALAGVVAMGRIMRVVAGDARDVVLFLSEDPSLCPLLRIHQLSFIRGMAARAEGTMGMGPY